MNCFEFRHTQVNETMQIVKKARCITQLCNVFQVHMTTGMPSKQDLKQNRKLPLYVSPQVLLYLSSGGGIKLSKAPENMEYLWP